MAFLELCCEGGEGDGTATAGERNLAVVYDYRSDTLSLCWWGDPGVTRVTRWGGVRSVLRGEASVLCWGR